MTIGQTTKNVSRASKALLCSLIIQIKLGSFNLCIYTQSLYVFIACLNLKKAYMEVVYLGINLWKQK